jgi:hypothetical protein
MRKYITYALAIIIAVLIVNEGIEYAKNYIKAPFVLCKRKAL